MLGKGEDLNSESELVYSCKFLSLVWLVRRGGRVGDTSSVGTRVEVMARADISVRSVCGSAFYDLTIAKDRGPYAGNPNNRHWLPQTTSHVRLHIYMNRIPDRTHSRQTIHTILIAPKRMHPRFDCVQYVLQFYKCVKKCSGGCCCGLIQGALS